MLPVLPLLPLPFRLPLPLGNTFYYFVLSAAAAAVFDSISGFFAVSRPASRFRFYAATAVAMMIMMDNCEGLIMMTLCVMRKLARTELDPASTQLNSTRLNSLLIMQNPNRAGAEQSRGTERILYCRPCLPSCNSTQRCLAGAGEGGAEP